MTSGEAYPVDAVIADLLRALSETGSAVLVAQPGAGKTTRVPPALLGEAWAADKRIIVVEPRRLAARSPAAFMARQARFFSRAENRISRVRP